MRWTVGAPNLDADAPRFLVALVDDDTRSFIWGGVLFSNKEHAHAIKDALNALPEGAVTILPPKKGVVL